MGQLRPFRRRGAFRPHGLAPPDFKRNGSAVSPVIALLSLVVALGLSAPAAASPGQLALVQDDPLLVQRGPEARDRALDEMARLGADAVKVQLPWAAVAARRARRGPRASTARTSRVPRRPVAALRRPRARRAGARTARDGRDGGAGAGMGHPPGATRRGSTGRARASTRAGCGPWASATRAATTTATASGCRRVDLWTIWNEPNHRSSSSRSGAGRAARGAAPLPRRSFAARWTACAARATRRTRSCGRASAHRSRRHGRAQDDQPIRFLREMFCVTGAGGPTGAGRRGCAAATASAASAA